MGRKPRRSVWDRVKEALSEAGRNATQTEAAKIAGVEQPSVSLWKTGAPSLDNAIALAMALNICVEWI
jgi:DNA-binding XRE family transcriptional regulator